MGDLVKVSQFSSVLEICFGVNLLFYYFELRPLIEKRFDQLLEVNRETVKKLSLSLLNTKDPQLTTGFVQAPHFVNYLLGELASFLTGVASFLSLVLLVTVGFSPDFSVRVWAMAVVLILLFATPISYLLLSLRLLKIANQNMRIAALKLKSQEGSAATEATSHPRQS